VPQTSTWALTNATLPYVMKLAELGWQDALRADPALAKGLNTHAGEVTYAAVAAAFGHREPPGGVPALTSIRVFAAQCAPYGRIGPVRATGQRKPGCGCVPRHKPRP